MSLGIVDRYVEGDTSPIRRSRRMTIIAQDPGVRGADGKIIRATVAVPIDRLERGPRSHRFHVVDYDATTGQLRPPVDLTDPGAPSHDRAWSYADQFAGGPAVIADDELVADPAFHAQNVYAIAARTLAAFEFALGRRVEWEFDSHHLYLVPNAFLEGNAFYSREDRALLFGYLPLEDGRAVHTCLSHDIVAHEVTHAILDGLRPRFMRPGLPDQPAFHEALGDIVALLSVFEVPELVEAALTPLEDDNRRIAADERFSASVASTVLMRVAEEFGEALSGVRGSALRRSIQLPEGDGWRSDRGFEEPHRRGEILVAALMRAFLTMWAHRVRTPAHSGWISGRAVAEEGARAASHLLTMVIRSLDYAPAIELEFGDVLDSLLVADEVVAPDDPHDYRTAVRSGFAAYGIEQPDGRIIDLTRSPQRFIYDHINAGAFRSSREEVYRFVWQNLEPLGLKPDYDLMIDAVRPAVRVGPDGLVVNEVVADYVQVVDFTAEQAVQRGMMIPAGVKPTTRIELWGGGTLIFDQFGRIKLHQRKPLDDWDRQSRRLEYLAGHGLFDTRERLGFSAGSSPGMRFADLHSSNAVAGEQW